VQKTESLGVFAGGVAHDFNNLLTAILGNAQLAKLDVPAPSPPHDALGQIEIAATRAARLCQQMMAYAGRSPLSPADLDLNTLISDTQPLIEATVGKKVRGVQLSWPLLLTRGEPNQLQQVVNPSSTSGRWAIKPTHRCAPSSFRQRAPDVVPGPAYRGQLRAGGE
jgi:signal transduction histidine kinase